MRRSLLTAALAPLLFAAWACAPVDDSSDDQAGDPASTQPGDASGATESGSAGSTDGAVDTCSTVPDQAGLTRAQGTLTVGTDSPAYDPWFSDDDPTNGKGFESAVAYAVAGAMGFSRDQVTWVKVPFNTSYAPGEKKFDFDINQISITPARAKVVDFSDGYYQAAQAVITLTKGDAAKATSLADLKGLKLGAQTGTTSLTAIRDVIDPDDDPAVFQNTNAAKQALQNGQVDGIVVDLPTAFYLTSAEIEGSTIVGQFQPEAGTQEEFGMLMPKGSKLTACVDDAVQTLTGDGTLQRLQDKWLSQVVDVPTLK